MKTVISKLNWSSIGRGKKSTSRLATCARHFRQLYKIEKGAECKYRCSHVECKKDFTL